MFLFSRPLVSFLCVFAWPFLLLLVYMYIYILLLTSCIKKGFSLPLIQSVPPFVPALDEEWLHAEEVEEDSRGDSSSAKLGGHIHLRRFRQFWESELHAPGWLLDFLEEGYRLPFVGTPPEPSCLPNNKSATDPAVRDFVEEELADHLKYGWITEITEADAHTILPLSVAKRSDGRLRLVVDASRQINPHLEVKRVRLEGIADQSRVVTENCYMASLDLHKCYYQLKVHPEHKKFLCIQWRFSDGRVRTFRWNVTFLGLSPLVHFITKVTRPVIEYLHRRGVIGFVYIDDFSIYGSTFDNCYQGWRLASSVLQKAGFIENKAKASPPTQRLLLLGFEVCSRTMRLYVPEEKMNRILSFARQLISLGPRGSVTARTLASFYGKVMACLPALGPSAHLLCRNGLALIHSVSKYHHHVRLHSIMEELERILAYLPGWNGFDIFQRENSSALSAKVWTASDASATGFAVIAGDTRAESDSDALLKRAFSSEEVKLSSGARELLALREFFKNPPRRYRHRPLVHFTDSAVVETVMKKGSPVQALHDMVWAILNDCRSHGIRLSVVWQPREDARLVRADAASRRFGPEDSEALALDLDDWGLADMSLPLSLGPPFQWDLFASRGLHRADS